MKVAPFGRQYLGDAAADTLEPPVINAVFPFSCRSTLLPLSVAL